MTYNGNRRLGDLFASRREKGHAGLPTLSVTLNSGLVNRQELDRKQDTALSPHEHLLVRSNDIVYNMMRMWQGAFGLADREGIVSPAYVVLRPKADIDPRYAAYLFKTPRMTYLFWAYSYGLTEDRLRLYFSDFAKIPVAVPSIAAQRRCAAALCSVQELLNIQRKLVTNSFATKAAVLRRLLHPNSEQLKSGWTEIEFGDLVDLVKKQFDPGAPSATTRACIELEHVEATTGVLLGTVATSNTSSTKLEFQPNDVLFGKLRPYLRKYWLADRAGVCSSEFWVLRVRWPGCMPEFLKYLLASEPFMRAVAASAGSKMPRAEWDYVSQASVLIPPVSSQKDSVAVMRMLDAEVRTRRRCIELLETERDCLIGALCVPTKPSTISRPSP